jgi:hypothetical protein
MGHIYLSTFKFYPKSNGLFHIFRGEKKLPIWYKLYLTSSHYKYLRGPRCPLNQHPQAAPWPFQVRPHRELSNIKHVARAWMKNSITMDEDSQVPYAKVGRYPSTGWRDTSPMCVDYNIGLIFRFCHNHQNHSSRNGGSWNKVHSSEINNENMKPKSLYFVGLWVPRQGYCV